MSGEGPRPLVVGVIGAGRIGQVHLSTLASLPFIRVAVLGDIFIDAAKRVAAKYGVPEVVSSPEAVVNHPAVEAVWICSPSSFHIEQIRMCADTGKHCFCEKPVASDAAEAAEVVAYAASKGIKLMTALQRRFDPHFARLKSAAEERLGRPIQLKLTSRDPGPPPFEYVKGGGGLFMDMAIHDLDMARFLMGSEPTQLLAVASCQIDQAISVLPGPEAFDTAVIIIKFRNGATATIDVCRKAPYGYDQRAEFLGTDSCISIENVHPSAVNVWSKDAFGKLELPHDFFMTRYKEAYVAETVAFANAIAAGKPPPVTGRDGLIALIMAEACAKSAAQSGWVDVDVPPLAGL